MNLLYNLFFIVSLLLIFMSPVSAQSIIGEVESLLKENKKEVIIKKEEPIKVTPPATTKTTKVATKKPTKKSKAKKTKAKKTTRKKNNNLATVVKTVTKRKPSPVLTNPSPTIDVPKPTIAKKVIKPSNVKEYIPKGVDRLTDVVHKEIKKVPQVDPWYFYSLIEQESCISLTHSKCWNEGSRLKTKLEEGAGLPQITRAYDKKGKLRFDNVAILNKKYRDLKEMTWDNIYKRPDLQVRSMVYLFKEGFDKLFIVKDKFERTAMSDAAYNGGYGHVNRERIACGVLKKCDPQKWFGNVANIKTVKSQKKISIYGNKSAWDINREHVTNTLKVRLAKYEAYYKERYKDSN